jgi:hypothetical protein
VPEALRWFGLFLCGLLFLCALAWYVQEWRDHWRVYHPKAKGVYRGLNKIKKEI